MCEFCKVWVCVCVASVKCGCVYVWVLKCVGVSLCEFCNVWLCVCVGSVKYDCVYMWVL